MRAKSYTQLINRYRQKVLKRVLKYDKFKDRKKYTCAIELVDRIAIIETLKPVTDNERLQVMRWVGIIVEAKSQGNFIKRIDLYNSYIQLFVGGIDYTNKVVNIRILKEFTDKDINSCESNVPLYLMY